MKLFKDKKIFQLCLIIVICLNLFMITLSTSTQTSTKTQTSTSTKTKVQMKTSSKMNMKTNMQTGIRNKKSRTFFQMYNNGREDGVGEAVPSTTAPATEAAPSTDAKLSSSTSTTPATPSTPTQSTTTQSTNSTNITTYSVDLTDPSIQLQTWMSISSTSFNDPRLFPKIKGKDGSKQYMLFGPENERLNEFNSKSMSEGSSNEYNFWFKIRGSYIYYFGTKEDPNMLGSIYVSKVENNFSKYRFANNTLQNQTCFDAYDPTNSRYKICATTMEDKLKWFCSLQKLLNVNQVQDFQCVPEWMRVANVQPLNQEIKIQKIIQPLIIIPKESRDCNDKWDYKLQGKDWECTCQDGREQSPINLPDKDEAVLSEDRPLFQYEVVSKSNLISTIDGFMTSGKNLQIMYDRGSIRITHPNMGKIVQLDGSVYNAEEIIFHTPSEHKINGVQYDMEMQIVHYGVSRGDIARQTILCILFKKTPSAYNKFFDKLDFFNLPNQIDKFRDINNDLFIPNIFYSTEDDDMPVMRPFSFYTYQGSITSPPCTERTTVYVTADPVELSPTTIELFKEALKVPDMINDRGNMMMGNMNESVENIRDTQELNGRIIQVFDHVKFNCPDYKPAKKNITQPGHYEKRLVNVDTFVHVNGNEPSGLAGSYVVSSDEAKGIDISS